MGQGVSKAGELPDAAKPEIKGSDENGPDLDGVSTETLLAEVQRRLNCLNKPDKRIILVGESLSECFILMLAS